MFSEIGQALTLLAQLRAATTLTCRCNEHSPISLLPLSTVRAFVPRRYDSAYLLPRLSALGCLNSLACLGTTLPSADFSRPVEAGRPTPSPLGQPGDLPG